jgi:hypothetical protein
MSCRGVQHYRFNGGTKVNDQGYLQITAGPLRGMYVHRLVAEAVIGRPLHDNEVVHHLDGDRLNPHPDNLEVMLDTLHGKERKSQFYGRNKP